MAVSVNHRVAFPKGRLGTDLGKVPLILPAQIPALDLDFIWDSALSSLVTFTRASSGTYFDAQGVLRTAATNVPRFDSPGGIRKGLLIEESRTNSFLNSESPATHTSPSLATGTYTLWLVGTGSVAVAENTATITGAGTATEGSPVTFEVTGAGTVDFTVTGSLTRAQEENGAFQTSYILTTTASVTRAADACTISDISGFFNAVEGTVLVELIPTVAPPSGVFQTILDLNDGTGDERVRIQRDSNSALTVAVTDGGVTQASITGGTLAANAVSRVAFAYKANDLVSVLNAEIVGTDTSAAIPSVDRIHVGRNVSDTHDLNGHIRRILYWPKRLPNDQLKALTI